MLSRGFKTQHGRIPIDSAILAAIEQQQQKERKKTKNVQVWGDACEDQKPEIGWDKQAFGFISTYDYIQASYKQAWCVESWARPWVIVAPVSVWLIWSISWKKCGWQVHWMLHYNPILGPTGLLFFSNISWKELQILDKKLRVCQQECGNSKTKSFCLFSSCKGWKCL